jgi:hypothetical protein
MESGDTTDQRQRPTHEQIVRQLFAQHPEIHGIKVSPVNFVIACDSVMKGEEPNNLMVYGDFKRTNVELVVAPAEIPPIRTKVTFRELGDVVEAEIKHPEYYPNGLQSLVSAVQVSSAILDHWRKMLPSSRSRIPQVTMREGDQYSGETGRIINLALKLIQPGKKIVYSLPL